MLHAGVEQPGPAPVEIGRSGSQRGNERQNKAYGRVQSSEFLFTGERQIEMDALQVGPAVGAAAENAVIFRVDFMILMRPEHGVLRRIHPWMGRRWHEAGAARREQGVDVIHAGVQRGKPALQRGFRFRALGFRHMGRQLVGPFHPAGRVAFRTGGGIGASFQIVEQGVHDGTDFPAFGVHHHIFDFYPVALKQGKGGLVLIRHCFCSAD